MIKRDKEHLAGIIAALALLMAIIVAYTMSSCSASRRAESSLIAAERISAISGMSRDSAGISIEKRNIENIMSLLETYSITIFDTSRRDSATGAYPVKAQINGTKQTDKTSVSSQVSADSSAVCEMENVGIHEESVTQKECESGFDSGPDPVSGVAVFVLVIALLIAIPYVFRYVFKNIL